MKREQLVFLAAGILFGFVGGFVVAWGITHSPSSPPSMPAAQAPRGENAPSAGNPGGDATMEHAQERIAALKGRIEQEPEDTKSLIELAGMYMQAGMYPQAQDYLVQAVAVDPEDAHARRHLGIVLGQLGDVSGAREQFEQVVRAEPGDWQGWYYLAVTTARAGDSERAREAVARVEALNPGLPELSELRQHLAEAAP